MKPFKILPTTDPFRIINGPDGIKLEANSNEIHPGDPGQGTPLLLTLPSGSTVTFACASQTGETSDGEQLTSDQKKWLLDIEPAVERWESYHTARISSLP